MQRAAAEWWRQPVVYQVNPPRFAASGVTGAGTLRGVTARIGYLAALGIDAVWLSPFDPSALADDGPGDGPGDGSGVVTAVRADGHPLPGTLADFDELSSGLHAHGIKLIVDLVPNYPPFDFELLEADWDAGEFLRGITDSRLGVPRHGVPATWVLSSQGADPRRARAAALLMLALPGSAFLHQGEELGLHEIADITPCIRAQDHDPGSTLNLYRQALSWRRKLQAADHLEWMPGTNGQVLHFRRPGGWRSVTNLGPRAVPLPPGTVVAASAPLASTRQDCGMLPPDTTAWIISAGS
jgi:alpha amylase-like protein